MREFETKVQYLNFKVLREVAKLAFDDQLIEKMTDIPRMIVPGKVPTMRCCVYKERAILSRRVKMACGGDKSNPNVIEVIDIACDDCPAGGYEVSNACRGCLAHRCESVCKRGAITFDHNQKAYIDKSKCVGCGACAKVCPYSAIVNNKRPCESSCKVKAITVDEETGGAKINNEKCISCGACVYQCPFGAITDKSFILDAINILKEAGKIEKVKAYAVVAPAISSQFHFAKLGQVISGLKILGFHTVIEAALGADLVAWAEAKELEEKGFLTSSCCPAFVNFVEKQFPEMKDNVSTNLSPAATIAKYVKETDENAKVVFIGPCTAKKMEFQKPEIAPFIDCVLTFNELQALFDSREIDIATLEESVLDNASKFGRTFARTGGLSEAVVEALHEQGSTFEVKPTACDGIEACKLALLKAKRGLRDVNFIEGMACVNGCIGGAGCLTHGDKNKNDVDKYGDLAKEKTILDAIEVIQKTSKENI